MKKTLSALVLIAILHFQACSSDKKERKNDTVSNNPPVSAADSTNPPDNTAVNPAEILPVDSNQLSNGPRVEQPLDTVNEYLYKGLMVYRDNIGEFVDCNTQRSYFVNDLTNELRGKYYSFELPPNGPLYVEVVGKYVRPGNKAPKKFQRQMNISHLNVMDRTVPFQCGGALTKLKSN